MNLGGDPLPLRLCAVGLERGRKRVLKDITYEFSRASRRTLIIGPNGAGKSLLLQICHGLVLPDEGEVQWSGALAPRALTECQAMVFQRPVLLRRSVAANVEFALALRGLGRRERRQRTAHALRRTGLARLADRPARALSFGEQQRLALARAMATEPRVLFLDEPTASLDPSAAHVVEDIVGELSEHGVRVIMTSHDLGQARRLADDVVFLHRGRIKEAAPSTTFFAGPQNDLAAAFLRGELLWWNRPNDPSSERCDDP